MTTPEDYTGPDDPVAIERYWKDQLKKYPRLGSIVSNVKLAPDEVYCVKCGYVYYVPQMNFSSHPNSRVCANRQQRIQAIREGLTDVPYSVITFPYIEPFIVRTTTDSFGCPANWVPLWWYDLWRSYRQDDCDEIFSELARAYGVNNTEEVQRIIGLIELSLAG